MLAQSVLPTFERMFCPQRMKAVMTTQVKENDILKLEFCKFLWHILDDFCCDFIYLKESNPTRRFSASQGVRIYL